MNPDRARAQSSGEPRARQLAAGLLPYLVAGEVVAVVILDRCDSPEHPDHADWRLGLAAPDDPSLGPLEVAEGLHLAAECIRAEAIAYLAERN